MLISARTERAFSLDEVDTSRCNPVYLEKQIRAIFRNGGMHEEMERKRDIRRDKLRCLSRSHRYGANSFAIPIRTQLVFSRPRVDREGRFIAREIE